MTTTKNPLRKALLKDSAMTFVTTILSRVGGLIFTIILARVLLPAGFGIYSLALSISILFVTFGDLGINQAMIHYVSSTFEKDRRKAAAYFKYLLKIKVVISLLSSLVLLSSAFLLAEYVFHKPALFVPLILFSVYTLILSVESFFGSVFFIRNRIDKLVVKEFVFQVGRIALLLVLFHVFISISSVTIAVTSLLLASLLSLGMVLLFYRKMSFAENTAGVIINQNKVFKFMGFLTLANIAGTIFSYVDTLIMGLYLSPEYIGYYRASINLVITLAGALSFPGVFLSFLSRIDADKLQQTFDKIMKVLITVAMPLTFGLLALSKYFLVLIYGYEYLEGNSLLFLLSPFIFLFATTSLFLSLFSAKEKTKNFALLTLFCAILTIVLDYTFINLLKRYSELSAAQGVALGTLFAWIIYFAGGVILLKKDTNIIFRFSYMVKPLIASVCMAGLIVVFNSYYPDMGLIKGIIEVIVGAGIYALILLAFGWLKREDFTYFLKVLRR